MDDKFSFFDLSGKTSRVDSVLPDSVTGRFQAPEPPRFQDIYGLDSGDSPLSRSGYGNTVRPSRGSKLSRMFFQDQDVKSTVGIGLTPEELDIPRESAEEESSRSFHEDKAVERDPGYQDALEGPATDPPAPPAAFDTPQPAGPLPADYGSSDLSQASFLPSSGPSYDDDTPENIDVSHNYRNGQPVEDAAGPVPGGASDNDSSASTGAGGVEADADPSAGDGGELPSAASSHGGDGAAAASSARPPALASPGGE